MLRMNDETTDHDTLHFAIEREWKQDRVQREFWRDHGYCRFYVPLRQPVALLQVEIPEDIGPAPIAYAQYDRETGFIVITTPLDRSYKWFIPVRFNPWGMIRTPLINPANRGRY